MVETSDHVITGQMEHMVGLTKKGAEVHVNVMMAVR